MGNDAAKGETYYNYNVTTGMGGIEGFQAGSTFKTFTLASALNMGMTRARNTTRRARCRSRTPRSATAREASSSPRTGPRRTSSRRATAPST
nr:hypothetical protein [Tessaracoccus coleopterorum]